MSHILGFAVTVAIWSKEVVACRDFILGSVATFWVMSLVGIYPGRASLACGAAGPRIAYSVDIVYKQGFKGLRAGYDTIRYTLLSLYTP